MVGGALIGFKTINRLNTIQSDWLEFRHITANKGRALSQIRNYFGFGGFIHNFQNYVSGRNPNMAGVVSRDMDELLAAVATYEVIGISKAERAAFADIRKVIANYRSNLIKAKQLIDGGGNSDDIARLMIVDNRPAFAALATLEVHWLEGLDSQTKQLMTGVTEGERLIIMAAVFVPILGLTVIVLLWFMQRLVQVTVETVKVDNELRISEKRNRLFIEATPDPAIKISDKGPGIPEDLREFVFDPFLRSDRRSGGAGLGLSIVRRAAELHNATIKISDAPGGGSVFTISFPPEAGNSGLA